jgi:hypothetical protein
MTTPPAFLLIMPQLIIIHGFTEDIYIPRCALDPNMTRGYRAIPVPPTSDPSWRIFSRRRKDGRTGWRRIRLVESAS